MVDKAELKRRLTDEHTIIPDWCRAAIAELLEELEYTENVAHRIADEAAEDEAAMRDEMREIEWRAKEEGMNGGWY